MNFNATTVSAALLDRLLRLLLVLLSCEVNMEVCCSFKSLSGGTCGNTREASGRVVPLLSCNKDIAGHLRSCKFSGPVNEVDLILCRAGLFSLPKDADAMTICPMHRSHLGIGWSRGTNTKCRVPSAVSGHGIKQSGKAKKPLPIADRGVSKHLSKALLKKTGVFIQAGSGNFYKYLFY